MKTNHTRKDMYIDIFGRWLMQINNNGMSEKQSRVLLRGYKSL
jgi:hypothetical protein